MLKKRKLSRLIALLLCLVFMIGIFCSSLIANAAETKKYFDHYVSLVGDNAFKDGEVRYCTDEDFYKSKSKDESYYIPFGLTQDSGLNFEKTKFVSKLDNRYYSYDLSLDVNFGISLENSYDSLDDASKKSKLFSFKSYKNSLESSDDSVIPSKIDEMNFYLFVGFTKFDSFEAAKKCYESAVLYILNDKNKTIEEIPYKDIYKYVNDSMPYVTKSNFENLRVENVSNIKSDSFDITIAWDSKSPDNNYVRELMLTTPDDPNYCVSSASEHCLEQKKDSISFNVPVYLSGSYHVAIIDGYNKDFDIKDIDIKLPVTEDSDDVYVDSEPDENTNVDTNINVTVSDIPKSTTDLSIPVTISVDKEGAYIKLDQGADIESSDSKSITYNIKYNGTYDYVVTYHGKEITGSFDVNCFNQNSKVTQTDWGTVPSGDENTDGKLAQTGVDNSALVYGLLCLLMIGVVIVLFRRKLLGKLFSLLLIGTLLLSNLSSYDTYAAISTTAGSSSGGIGNLGGTNPNFAITDIGVDLWIVDLGNDDIDGHIVKHKNGNNDSTYDAESLNYWGNNDVRSYLENKVAHNKGASDTLTYKNGKSYPCGQTIDPGIIEHEGWAGWNNASGMRKITNINVEWFSLTFIDNFRNDDQEFSNETYIKRWIKDREGASVANSVISSDNLWIVQMPFISVESATGAHQIYGYSYSNEGSTDEDFQNVTNFINDGFKVNNAKGGRHICGVIFKALTSVNLQNDNTSYTTINLGNGKTGYSLNIDPNGSFKNTSSTHSNKKFRTRVANDHRAVGAHIAGISSVPKDSYKAVASNLITYLGNVGDSRATQAGLWDYDGGVALGYYGVDKGNGDIRVYSRSRGLANPNDNLKVDKYTGTGYNNESADRYTLDDKVYRISKGKEYNESVRTDIILNNTNSHSATKSHVVSTNQSYKKSNGTTATLKIGDGEITESRKNYKVIYSSIGTLRTKYNSDNNMRSTLYDLLKAQSTTLSGADSVESRVNNGEITLGWKRVESDDEEEFKDYIEDYDEYTKAPLGNSNLHFGYTYEPGKLKYDDNHNDDSASILGSLFANSVKKTAKNSSGGMLAGSKYIENKDINKSLKNYTDSGFTLDYTVKLLAKAYNEKGDVNRMAGNDSHDGAYELHDANHTNDKAKQIKTKKEQDPYTSIAVANTVQVRKDKVRSAQTTFQVDIKDCTDDDIIIRPKRNNDWDENELYESIKDSVIFDTPRSKVYYYILEERSENTLSDEAKAEGKTVNSASIEDFNVYKSLDKNQSVVDFCNYVKSKGNAFSNGCETVVLGISSHNNNPMTDNDSNYGYNVYYIRVVGSPKAEAKLELYDYQLNHVYASLLDETKILIAPSLWSIIGKGMTLPEKVTLVTNNGIKKTRVRAGESTHGYVCYNGSGSEHSYTESILYKDNGSESEMYGQTVTKNDEFLNTTDKLPLILQKGNGLYRGVEAWYKRSELNNTVTQSLSYERAHQKEVDFSWNLSRGTSEDKRTLSGISYTENEVTRPGNTEATDAKEKVGVLADNPYWAYNQLEMDGIAVDEPITLTDSYTAEDNTLDKSYYDSNALVIGKKMEVLKYDGLNAGWNNHSIYEKEKEDHYVGGRPPHSCTRHRYFSTGEGFDGFIFNNVEVTDFTLYVRELYYKYRVKQINNTTSAIKDNEANKTKKKYQYDSCNYGETQYSQYMKDYIIKPTSKTIGSQPYAVFSNEHSYALPYLQRYKEDESNVGSNKTKDIYLKYYPEVTMSVQYYNSETLTSSANSVLFTTVETLGEEQRKTRSSGLYLTKLLGYKSPNDATYKLNGSIFSDTSALNADDSDLINSENTSNTVVYNGSDVTLNADTSNLGLQFYGYAIDVIREDDTLEGYGGNYNGIVRSGLSNESWGNNGNKAAIKEDFENYINEFAKLNNFAADITLEIGKGTDASATELSYNNYSTTIGKLQSLSDVGTEEAGVYALVFDHGKLVKTSADDTSNNNRYIGITCELDAVSDEDYEKAEKLFKASELYTSVLDSIESDTEGLDGSIRNKNNSRAVATTETSNGNRNTSDNAIDSKNHWYDEEVVTVVVRRFKTKDSLKFKNVILSDKVDYDTKTAAGGTGKWYLSLYMDNLKDDIDTKLRNGSTLSYYNPSKRKVKYGNTGEDGGYEDALKNGTVLMDHIYINNCDFQISGQSTDLAGN